MCPGEKCLQTPRTRDSWQSVVTTHCCLPHTLGWDHDRHEAPQTDLLEGGLISVGVNNVAYQSDIRDHHMPLYIPVYRLEQ